MFTYNDELSVLVESRVAMSGWLIDVKPLRLITSVCLVCTVSVRRGLTDICTVSNMKKSL